LKLAPLHLLLCCLALLSACAVADPYERLAPEPTPELGAATVEQTLNQRWPEQFKAVQTVTLDFGPVTRTLVGYLVVQRPGRFRLQGMTEHGIRLFDITGDGEETRVIFAAEEFEDDMLESIARDIRRLFVRDFKVSADASVDRGTGGTRVRWGDAGLRTEVMLVSNPPRLDHVTVCRGSRRLWRADQYEWQDFEGMLAPSIIVLRERGVESRGPAYTLTIQTTELESRDTPWPAAVFE
jgi:hypothetical protein